MLVVVVACRLSWYFVVVVAVVRCVCPVCTVLYVCMLFHGFVNGI